MRLFKIAIAVLLLILAAYIAKELLTSKKGNAEKWRSDALAYVDEIIAQSDGKNDVVSNEYNSYVIIQSAETLEKIKVYINNAQKSIQDMTGISRKPSPTPFYSVGTMPWSCYDGFEFEYDSPYQLISISFTETDTQELLDYLNSVLNNSN
ncbi:MAG: hypothetical protein LBT88_02475 [Oscillospiraceae bacterium]|jgi:hypothetical protein|nr:hypothetical protein [Oscillospiraceae bacterium]